MVRVESVWLPSCPSQTTTSWAPPARNPSTAALISPVSNWRISGSLGSVWSCRQTPPTPSASVMRKTVLFCPQAAGKIRTKSQSRKRIPTLLPHVVVTTWNGFARILRALSPQRQQSHGREEQRGGPWFRRTDKVFQEPQLRRSRRDVIIGQKLADSLLRVHEDARTGAPADRDIFTARAVIAERQETRGDRQEVAVSGRAPTAQ